MTERLEQSRDTPEPIAIVGMACRFAGGVDSPEKFWRLLRDGRDAIGEVPEERWAWYARQSGGHAAALRDVTKSGAFLDDIKGFDADFFDLTPREAALMDPQQRIVLELAWEALEHAGIPPRSLAGTDTGVFMGVGADDYGRRLLEDLPRIEAWTGIGSSFCAVANRVSYALDLRGPSAVVDTACSSSLVSIHLAAQALRAGECPVALAGGVLIMAAPGLSLVLDAAGATSPDGRCKSFDATADGYGRGEGGGIVVLKRLSDAERDGDHVLAVLRGSAVHQDGRTNGIMAPSGDAQAHLMRRAYETAGIDPATVGYVEAHGTGTRAGDPLEAAAMASVFGKGRPVDEPCLIGSVKPNIGHLEAGAGVAGVIKAVLALQHAEIPPSLNCTEPNPAIPWEEARLRVVTGKTPFPESAGPRRAGVSGYGYGGTIAHVILEESGAEVAQPSTVDCGPALFPLSGASPEALRKNAGRLVGWLTGHRDVDLTDVGHTLAVRRPHLPHRATVFAADRTDLVNRLGEVAVSGPDSVAGPAAAAGVVWVFSGHGSQWIGMGRELLDTDPVFTEVFDRLEPIFTAELGVSPRATVRSDARQPVDVIQPMIFAMQVALAETWRARGLRPAAVIGHSVGEIAAAVTAGVFSLEDGARLACRRSVLLRRVAGQGGMVMVALPPEDAETRLAGRTDLAVAVAAATTSTVVSGDVTAIQEFADQLRAEGTGGRLVDSDVAFHSAHMDPLLDELAAAVDDLEPRPAGLPLYSTALTDPRAETVRDGTYWAGNLRNQVRFVQALTAALQDGYRLFLEVSPHPVVEHSINETFDGLGITDGFATHTLRRAKPERETMLTNLGQLYGNGAEVDWRALWPGGGVADLPTYAWQHKPHWAEEPEAPTSVAEHHDVAGHTLLGGRTVVRGTTPAHVWATRLDRDSRPYPGSHPVRNVEIIPAAVLLNTFATAAASVGPWSDLAEVSLRVPVSVTSTRDLQVVLQDGAIRLSSRLSRKGAPAQNDTDGAAGADSGWATHTTATIEPRTAASAEAPAEAGERLPAGFVIDRLASLGVAAMGFPWVVEEIHRGEGTLVATVRAEPEPGTLRNTWASVLDAALSTASVVFTGPPILRMPAHIQRVSLGDTPPARATITVRQTGELTVDVEITDPDGVLAGRLAGLRYGVLDGAPSADSGTGVNPRELVHPIGWQPADRTEPAERRAAVLVGPDSALIGRLTERLAGAAVPFRVVAGPEELTEDELSGGHDVLVVPGRARPGTTGSAAAETSWLLAATAQRLASGQARLWCVTQGVRRGADEAALAHASAWGVGRIIGGEHPEIWGGVVDVGDSPEDVPALLDVLTTVRGEDVVAIQDGEPLVPRLLALDGEPSGRLRGCQPDGTYLVTGGLGVLGLRVAQWLADRGARRIVLAGRHGLPPRDTWDTETDPETVARLEAVRSLERLGVTVVAVAVDIADHDEAARLLSPAALGLPPFRGVVHAAGVLDNRALRTLDEESLRTVLRPKVAGGLTLHKLFPPGSVDFFALFSSSGYLLGLPGQASYAAANAFLDALAAHRRAAGDRGTTSFGWTSWRGLGMSTSSAIIDVELAARGTADIALADAFAAWEVVEQHDLGYAAVLRTVPLGPGDLRLPVLSALPEDAAQDAGGEQEQDEPWAGLTGPELVAVLTAEIRAQVSAETQLPAAEVDPRRPLVEMGLDSVMTVRIRRGLERRFGLQLPSTLFWDRPTVEAVVELLAERLTPEELEQAA
ncbi:type I polyketide synthase [Amycolatopsis sp., V23-08]|uniref:Type I polyketide synthase n=1 Tax=Amycolatopsis heterodermiae TaxID=3110235 RepID=A0ABU5RN22_9PSEU|nr:type I polyketide synthase [Amycolatopsis sp., V23-08]MEA5366924.1 type I polyketide synthase [Amycolatopsis sp., V23-08]